MLINTNKNWSGFNQKSNPHNILYIIAYTFTKIYKISYCFNDYYQSIQTITNHTTK